MDGARAPSTVQSEKAGHKAQNLWLRTASTEGPGQTLQLVG